MSGGIKLNICLITTSFLQDAYILGAIAAGAGVRTGQGHGPLNHGYAPVAQRVVGA